MQNTIANTIAVINAAGIALSLTDDNRLRAVGQLTDDLRQLIRENRDAIIAHMGGGTTTAIPAPSATATALTAPVADVATITTPIETTPTVTPDTSEPHAGEATPSATPTPAVTAQPPAVTDAPASPPVVGTCHHCHEHHPVAADPGEGRPHWFCPKCWAAGDIAPLYVDGMTIEPPTDDTNAAGTPGVKHAPPAGAVADLSPVMVKCNECQHADRSPPCDPIHSYMTCNAGGAGGWGNAPRECGQFKPDSRKWDPQTGEQLPATAAPPAPEPSAFMPPLEVAATVPPSADTGTTAPPPAVPPADETPGHGAPTGTDTAGATPSRSCHPVADVLQRLALGDMQSRGILLSWPMPESLPAAAGAPVVPTCSQGLSP